MKKSNITFDELRELLIDLGFGETLEKTRIRFAHPTTRTVLLFRVYGPRHLVYAHDTLLVRRQLVDNGLMEAGDFERFLEKASA